MSTVKPTLANVRREAERYGAEVEYGLSGRYDTITIDLPAGKVWVANGCHCLSCSVVIRLVADQYRDLLEQMAYGTDDCDDPECDFCYPV